MLTLRATAYEFGPYRLDPLGRSLARGRELVALPPKAVEVLMVLIKHAGAVIGKPELIEAVWPETIVEEANLNQMIFLLRRAFGEDSATGYIATVPRRGYRFTAGVRTIEIPCRIESIAVLPLANVSGDPAREYFADGITEALITELAKIRSLRVVSRTSVMRYRGTKGPIAQIARALRAQALLEGSVMTSGDRFRITVQLTHAGADQSLWAQTYQGAASDILDVQARVARDVAARLRAELSRDERARLTTLRTVHPQAFALPQRPLQCAHPHRRGSAQGDPIFSGFHPARSARRVRLLLRIGLCGYCGMLHRARVFLRDGAEGGVRRGGGRGRQGGDPGRSPRRGTRGARSSASSQ
jgi:TolB-like protein